MAADVSITVGFPRRALGDQVRLRAAVENLIDNAVKFGRTGTVRLAISATAAAGQRTLLTFELTDEGIGLSKSDLRRLFRPFAQGKAGLARQFAGAGLGLAFARRIARAMQGDVTVASVPGQGSTFRLTAMVEPAPAPDNAGVIDAARANPSTARVLRLLCAEDNPYGRVVLNTMASALGHRIDFVESGDAAVNAVRHGGYDAVLMDVMLPGGDGMQATRRIRALAGAASAVPIIGISGRGTADEAAAHQAGMNAYLVKPVSPSTLSRALDSVLQDRSGRGRGGSGVRRAGSVRRSPKAPPRR
jgi:CheY-like chemotaxis protein/anti-sigma regulatory factor (Ser/Thr protein kinase)